MSDHPNTMNGTTKRAALYARVSTVDKDQTPETQLVRLRSWAASEGYEIYQEYVDHASGADPNRPAMERMMADARGHRFNVVVAIRLDRLTRSLINLLTTLQEMERSHVQVIFLDQRIDTTKPEGRFLIQVIGAAAEFERELISARVKDGMARAKVSGIRLGRPRRRVTKSEIEKVCKQQASGMTLGEITDDLGISRRTLCRRLKSAKMEGIMFTHDSAPEKGCS